MSIPPSPGLDPSQRLWCRGGLGSKPGGFDSVRPPQVWDRGFEPSACLSTERLWCRGFEPSIPVKGCGAEGSNPRSQFLQGVDPRGMAEGSNPRSQLMGSLRSGGVDPWLPSDPDHRPQGIQWFDPVLCGGSIPGFRFHGFRSPVTPPVLCL